LNKPQIIMRKGKFPRQGKTNVVSYYAKLVLRLDTLKVYPQFNTIYTQPLVIAYLMD
jgi:hypothetical protein